MTDETIKKLDDFLHTISNGQQQPLLVLDYDGTLAPFRVDRHKARPWTGVREAIGRIQRQGRTRMVVITGRPAKEIGPLLRGHPPVVDPMLEVWGLHGAERLHPDGKRELEPVAPETQRKLDEVREHLRHNNLGGQFEDKPNAAVMHWRGASPRTAKFIEMRTRELFEPLSKLPGMTLLPFEGGLELRVGRDKGGAISALVSEAEPGVPVAFVGDDLTDEAGFKAVNQAEGPHLSVLMRPDLRDTAADIWLRPPSELRGFLKRWYRALEAA